MAIRLIVMELGRFTGFAPRHKWCLELESIIAPRHESVFLIHLTQAAAVSTVVVYYS
jgi:hypothetical protein